jgi:hypothetical protein
LSYVPCAHVPQGSIFAHCIPSYQAGPNYWNRSPLSESIWAGLV